MKTVLILTPSFLPEIGGVETRFNDICNELDRTGYKVYVLTYQPLITKARGLPRETRGNITIERIPWIGFDLFHKLKPYPVLQALYLCPAMFIKLLAFLLRRHKEIDVIHSAGFNASLVARIVNVFFKKRWVVSTHAIYDLKKKSFTARVLRWVLKRADIILTLSEPSRQELIKIGIGPGKIINQITWVNQDIFKPMDREESRKRAPQKVLNKNGFIVLFVGRLLEIKGVKDLLRVAKETPSIDYIFIGEGALSGILKGEMQTSSNIYFLSRIENNYLPWYYNAADVFIMPSQYKEGLGRVVVESLYCGTPVIASNLGGLAGLLDEGVAVLIEPNRETIKKAILDLKNDPERLKKMRAKCREFALKKFGVGNFEVILQAYNFN